jgi:hypothetical protein
MVTTAKLQMPKGPLMGTDGKLTAAGQHYLAELGNRLANSPTQNAAAILAGGGVTVYAQSIWDTMVTDTSQGAGTWSPDLTAKLDFTRTVTGVSTIAYPTYELGDPNLFYSVLIKQGNGGGWTVGMGSGFQGTAPVILSGSGDQTLLGFKLLSPSTFTGWTIKQIPAS